MKIRNGFVSNSSSSSFVIIGFKLSIKKINKKEMLEKFLHIDTSNMNKNDIHDTFFDEMYNSGKVIFDSENNILYVGKIIIETGCDGEVSTSEISLTELNNDMKNAKKIIKDLGVDSEPKLYTGTILE